MDIMQNHYDSAPRGSRTKGAGMVGSMMNLPISLTIFYGLPTGFGKASKSDSATIIIPMTVQSTQWPVSPLVQRRLLKIPLLP